MKPAPCGSMSTRWNDGRAACNQAPASLVAEREGAVAVLRLNRPHKRNALDDETIIGIETILHLAAGWHRRRLARRRRRAFLRRPRLDGIEGTRRYSRHCPFRLVASRVREDSVRQGAGGRRAARRGGRRRSRTCRRGACARRRALGLLRAAGRQPRHLCRRRRFGAAAAADRRRAHDGHDADRAHLFAPRKARPSG